jgi:uncharacterized protein YgiM (DUF1202 family)
MYQTKYLNNGNQRNLGVQLTKSLLATVCVHRIAINIPLVLSFLMLVAIAPTALQAADPAAKSKTKQVPAYITVQHEQPRVRSVHTLQAVVRAGPSDQTYSTLKLPKGSTVDVYLESSDGWSGIRPPAGSHNWIPSSAAYLLPGGKLAEIAEPNTPAWIGSDNPDTPEFKWQVELQKSQQVSILGEEQQLGDDGKKQTWYRIAPPQGEFRWIKTSQLSDTPQTKNEPTSDPSAKHATTSSPVQLAQYEEPATYEEIPSVPNATGEPSTTGAIVWSNEQEALAKVNKQIQGEQAAVERQMAADGIPSNQMRKMARSIGPSQSTPSQSTPSAIAESKGRSRPILSLSKPGKSIETQTEVVETPDGSFDEWNAMHSNETQPDIVNRLRVGPMKSILGLIGINVVEADRVPVNAQIARSQFANSGNSNMGQAGAYSGSRLDRLPRPGQNGSNNLGPVMTMPAESVGFVPGMGMMPGMQQGSNDYASQSPVRSPLVQGEGTFAKWFHSRQPIFGSNMNGSQTATNGYGYGPQGNPGYANNGAPFVSANGYPGNAIASAPNAIPPFNPSANGPTSIPQDHSQWHGLSSTSTAMPHDSAHDMAQNGTHDGANDSDEFQTPEIQNALVSLTNEIGSPTERWNLTPLRNQASAWIENGATAMVRGEARLLMERIERFESLRQRTLGIVQDTSMMAQQMVRDRANAVASSLVSNAAGVITASATQNPNASNPIASGTMSGTSIASGQPSGQEGDASGWLVQVHTSNPGQPEFALTDDAGNVIAYVQTNAGLNLRRYLQQPVTIYGIRGYLPGLAAKQILAERVVRVR